MVDAATPEAREDNDVDGDEADDGRAGKRSPDGGVQSIERAFDLLELLAAAGGQLTISQLASQSPLPMTTIHRLLRTLAARGYVRQELSKSYTLGPRLIHLGGTASRLLGAWSRPYLDQLVEATGESANLTVLDADEVVYVAQVPSRHLLRMFTEVGRRTPPYCTASGKALLAQLDDERVRATLLRTGLVAHTPRTLTTIEGVLDHLSLVRSQGYAVDDGEHAVGVRCIAVPVTGGPRVMAISVSGPEGRLSLADASRFIPTMRAVAVELVEAMNRVEPVQALQVG